MPVLTPCGDRVLLKIDEAESKTAGGLLLPEQAKQESLCGTVIEIGIGRLSSEGELIPMELRAGDRVVIAKHTGTEIKMVGLEGLHRLVAERDVLVRLESE